MKQSKVSIIIPAHNASKFIAETIDCTKGITYPNWECVIVNDGSTDNTLEVINRSVKNDPRFKIITQSNRGVSASRNAAIRHSTGNYIFPLDADDLIHPAYIGKAAKILDETPNTKVVYCNAKKFGHVNEQWTLPDYSFKALLMENMIFCTALFRHSDFLKTRGYDENLHLGREDWDFWIELLKSGGEVFKIPEVLFFYRIHKRKQGSHNRTANLNLAEIRKHVFENHKELYAYFFENPIQIAHEHAFF